MWADPRRLLALLGVIVTVGLISPLQVPAQTLLSTGRPFHYSAPVPLPDNGALFGAFIRPDDHTGADRREALTNFEALLGRPMATERVYKLWDDPFPDADDLWSRDTGHTLYMSWNASPRDLTGCKPWADIASGLYDSNIHARALELKSFAAPIIFSFHHEPTTKPESGGTCGTGADYKAAWRRIHDKFVAAGVTNVTYAFTMTALSFDKGRGDEFYPGDDVIDLIAADGYNWYSCEFHQGPWREMKDIFESFYDYGVAKDKPMFIAEYGTGEDDANPNRKAQWFANGADLLKSWPSIVGVSYFNVGTGGACDRYVDSSQPSLDASTAMGTDPYFNPPPPVSQVTVADFSFTPSSLTLGQGGGVNWTFNGPSQHTVTQSRMGLFDSGAMSPGSTYGWFFPAAGVFVYECSIHPSQMQAAVKVPVVATPPSGGVTTVFTIKWSAEWAPTGFAFDVQIKRPGGNWTTWHASQTPNLATFVPDAGTGQYSFRARYRDIGAGSKSGYSPAVTITVS